MKLSFNKKLYISLSISIVSYVVIALLITTQLLSMKSSSTSLHVAQKLESNLYYTQLLVERASASLYGLEDVPSSEKRAIVELVIDSNKNLKESIDRINQKHSIIKGLNHIHKEYDYAIKLFEQAVVTKDVLGTSDQAGLLGTLRTNRVYIQTELDGFSSFASAFLEVVNKEASYLSDPKEFNLEQLMAALSGFVESLNSIGFYDNFKTSIENYQKSISEVDEVLVGYTELIKETNALLAQLEDDFELLTTLIDSDLLQTAAERSNTILGAVLILVPLMLLIVSAVVLSVNFSIIRSLKRSITRLTSAMGAIMDGDLSKNPLRKTEINGDFENLNNFIFDMYDFLVQIIQKISDSSSELATEAESSLTHVDSLAKYSDQQRSDSYSIVQAVSVLNDKSSVVEQAAVKARTSAKEIDRRAEDATEIVKKSDSAVRSLSEKIEHASEDVQDLNMNVSKIVELLETIESIATQTNLLALNAAIEAARAGDQGRGFSVVADEVRLLAGRTAETTDQIKETIGSLSLKADESIAAMKVSIEGAEEAQRLSEDVVTALHIVLDEIKSVTKETDEVSQISELQSSLSNAIENDINQIKQIIEDSSTLVEEIKGQVATTKTEVGNLYDIVKFFRLSE